MIILKLSLLWLIIGFVTGIGLVYISPAREKLISKENLEKVRQEKTSQNFATYKRILESKAILMILFILLGPIIPIYTIYFIIKSIILALRGEIND